MIVIVLANLNLSLLMMLLTTANLHLFGHRDLESFVIALLDLSLLLNLLLHLHEPLELEPFSDLLFPPSLFLFDSPFLCPMALLLRQFLVFALAVLVIILSLLVAHTLPLLL